jgi:hypothetical protein
MIAKIKIYSGLNKLRDTAKNYFYQNVRYDEKPYIK